MPKSKHSEVERRDFWEICETAISSEDLCGGYQVTDIPTATKSVGIDREGSKHILGLDLGATENAAALHAR